ncbi:hypothetical protein Bca101_045761 [Brassica carinata]
MAYTKELDKHTLLQKANSWNRLATIIWAKNETEDAFSENRLDQAKDVPLVEQKRVNDTRMDKDKREEQGGTDEFNVLQDALEAATSFQSLGKTQRKM